MRKINKIDTGAFFAVGMSLFALHLYHVCRAESHARTTGNAVVSAGFREALKLDMPAVSGAHMQGSPWVLHRNHGPIDTPDSHPHPCDQAPATYQNVSDHSHKRFSSAQLPISNAPLCY
jgi:hypothetical protein